MHLDFVKNNSWHEGVTSKDKDEGNEQPMSIQTEILALIITSRNMRETHTHAHTHSRGSSSGGSMFRRVRGAAQHPDAPLGVKRRSQP